MGPSENAKQIIRATAGEMPVPKARVRLFGSRLDDTERLDTEEAAALAAALADVPGEAWLFGSRLDPARRGGDIDVLVLTEAPAFETSQRIATRFFSRCEEKIDVVVMNPLRLSAEQADFLARINRVRIP